MVFQNFPGLDKYKIQTGNQTWKNCIFSRFGLLQKSKQKTSKIQLKSYLEIWDFFQCMQYWNLRSMKAEVAQAYQKFNNTCKFCHFVLSHKPYKNDNKCHYHDHSHTNKGHKALILTLTAMSLCVF